MRTLKVLSITIYKFLKCQTLWLFRYVAYTHQSAMSAEDLESGFHGVVVGGVDAVALRLDGLQA